MRHDAIAFLLLAATSAQAAPGPDDLAGRITATHEGREIELPLLRSDLTVEVQGDMATVEIVQTFENPAPVALNAEYLFPMNRRAAVYAMEMRVGDVVTRAVIREKEKAEAQFEAAKEAGQSAALLTQHRPNMFTQSVANLMPGQPVEIRLRYVQTVPKVDGLHELVVPMIVGPRYVGATDDRVAAAADDVAPGPAPAGSWALGPVPDYPGVAGLDLPETVAQDRVSLDLTLTSGLTLGDFGSATHPLAVERGDGVVRASFAEGRVLDNSDLVVRWGFEGAALEAAALTHRDERGGFVSLMIEPPEAASVPAAPRELIFVLDTSGSMTGEPMEASKRFMEAALSGLRPEDSFRIVPFANIAAEMSRDALPATPANLQAGRRYVRGLAAGGGTEIDRAIRTAFATARQPGALRIVVFLSDGYIGDEATVLRTIRRRIGEARIYAFGVGAAPNRYLLDAMAEEGRGYARYVGLDEEALEVAETLARDLRTPLLTDIEIDWGGAEVIGVSPARVPDLFAGGSVRVYARHDGERPSRVTVRGRSQGRAAEMAVPLVEAAAAEPALPLVWARTRIADLERAVAVGEDAAAADAEITRLGLDFSLQTRNTSFVAVAERVVNEGGPAQDRAVPLPMVQGVTAEAYPALSGSSTPEPRALLGLLVLAALSVLRMRRRA